MITSEHKAVLVILKDDAPITALGFMTVSHAISVVESQLKDVSSGKAFNYLTSVFEKGVKVDDMDETYLITDPDTYFDTYTDDDDDE